MIAKIAVFLAVVAVAYGGVASVVSYASPPASTVKLANVAYAPLTYAAGPSIVAGPALTYAAGPALTYAAGPAVVAAPRPIAYAAAPVVTYAAAPVAIPAPVAYATAPKIIQTIEPVEQHGYKIAY